MTTTPVQGLAEYLSGLLAGVAPLRGLTMPLLDAHGLTLAADVSSDGPLPPVDAAGIEGYAVRAADVEVLPARLAVVGDLSPASWQAVAIAQRACYFVEQGAPLPAGADAVVPTDATDAGLATVEVRRPVRPGDGIRRAGVLLPPSTLLATEGTRLDAGLLALLAAAGVEAVAVRPPPRVVIAAIGDELVDVGTNTGAGQVTDANSYALVAAAREAGAQAVRLPIVPDDAEALRRLLEDQFRRADLLVLAGGAGTGRGDVVRRLFGHSATVEFADLPIHPRGALGFGLVGPDDTHLACLPGDPAGALIGFEVLVRPVIRRLAGDDRAYRRSAKAVLTEPVSSPRGLREFRPALVSERRGGGYQALPLAGGSQLLTGYASANGLLVLGERVTDAPAGSTVDVLMFDRAR